MTKILFIRENIPGGIGNYCKSIERMYAHSTELTVLPIRDYPVVHSRLFHYYYKWKELASDIRQTDIVHINGYTAMGTVQAFLMALYYHKRIVYTAHWHPFQYLGHPFLGRLFFRVVLRPLVRRAHVVVTINEEDSAFFRSFHNSVCQIPHVFALKTKAQPQPKQPDMILFVGRLYDHVKGCEHLDHIPQGRYAVHCVGKGPMPQRPDFVQHVNISDDELASLYARASLLVIPSKYEAFSYVALEAFYHNTPVVMSDRVRIADYLQDVKGYSVFRYHDYDDFLRKIEQTIGTQVDVERIMSLFDEQPIKARYDSVYRKATE